jgi:hypothetical protein
MHIRVSAKILNLPNLCCCCGSTGATEKYEARAATTAEKQEVKAMGNAWNFPICHRCNSWLEAKRNASIWLAISLIAGFLLAVGLLISLSQEGEGPRRWAISAIFFVFASFCLITHQKKRRDSARLKVRAACTRQPVQYEGGSGSVHGFDFANEEFARAFLVINSKKIVGW